MSALWNNKLTTTTAEQEHRLLMQQERQNSSNVSSIYSSQTVQQGQQQSSSRLVTVQQRNRVVATISSNSSNTTRSGGIGRKNLIIGSSCVSSVGGDGSSTTPTPAPFNNPSKVTPPTRRVRAKIVLRNSSKDRYHNYGGLSSTHTAYQFPSTCKATSKSRDKGGVAPAPFGERKRFYTQRLTSTTQSGYQYVYHNEAEFEEEEEDDVLVEENYPNPRWEQTRLLTASTSFCGGSSSNYSAGSSSNYKQGPSPSPSFGSYQDRVLKLTTRVTTLEEILKKSSSGTNWNMDGASSSNNDECNVNFGSASSGGGPVGRCSSTNPANQPKRTVQFKQFSTSGGARPVMSAPPAASISLEGERVSIAGPSSSHSLQAQYQANKPSSSNIGSMIPPQITISPHPSTPQRGESLGQLGSSGRLKSLSPDPEQHGSSASQSSSTSEPVSDDGEQEIIDSGDGLGGRPLSGNGGGGKRSCCRRWCCSSYYCCCGFGQSPCCGCCRDVVAKHHHQGNYSQGPTIETEPVAGSQAGVASSSATVQSGESFHGGITPFLPLCLVSVFGFISKVSWGVLETLFGFNRGPHQEGHGKDGGKGFYFWGDSIINMKGFSFAFFCPKNNGSVVGGLK